MKYAPLLLFLATGSIFRQAACRDDTKPYDPAQDDTNIINWLMNEHHGWVSRSVEMKTVQNEKYDIPQFRMYATNDI